MDILFPVSQFFYMLVGQIDKISSDMDTAMLLAIVSLFFFSFFYNYIFFIQFDILIERIG